MNKMKNPDIEAKEVARNVELLLAVTKASGPHREMRGHHVECKRSGS
jgi:hypothetical protein